MASSRALNLTVGLTCIDSGKPPPGQMRGDTTLFIGINLEFGVGQRPGAGQARPGPVRVAATIAAVQGFIDARLAELAAMWADPLQRVALAAGLAGAVLVIWSGVAKTIVPLRWLAVGSNLAFVVYGWVHPAPLVLLLHLLLLPINLWRVLEMRRLVMHVQRARSGEGLPQVWLQPYMKRRRLRAGHVLFSKGDPADRLYVLAEGALHVVESHRVVQPGELIGEISFFSRDGKRTATVVSPVGGPGATLLSIDEPTFRQLFHQNPAFGYEVVRLVTERLTADATQLRAELAQARQAQPGPGGAR